jgi:hypothetical protein
MTNDALPTTQRQDSPIRGRWGPVAAALLVLFSVGRLGLERVQQGAAASFRRPR